MYEFENKIVDAVAVMVKELPEGFCIAAGQLLNEYVFVMCNRIIQEIFPDVKKGFFENTVN